MLILGFSTALQKEVKPQAGYQRKGSKLRPRAQLMILQQVPYLRPGRAESFLVPHHLAAPTAQIQQHAGIRWPRAAGCDARIGGEAEQPQSLESGHFARVLKRTWGPRRYYAPCCSKLPSDVSPRCTCPGVGGLSRFSGRRKAKMWIVCMTGRHRQPMHERFIVFAALDKDRLNGLRRQPVGVASAQCECGQAEFCVGLGASVDHKSRKSIHDSRCVALTAPQQSSKGLC